MKELENGALLLVGGNKGEGLERYFTVFLLIL